MTRSIASKVCRALSPRRNGRKTVSHSSEEIAYKYSILRTLRLIETWNLPMSPIARVTL